MSRLRKIVNETPMSLRVLYLAAALILVSTQGISAAWGWGCCDGTNNCDAEPDGQEVCCMKPYSWAKCDDGWIDDDSNYCWPAAWGCGTLGVPQNN